VSDLEQKLREALKLAQDAHELSHSYPNPFTGIPSPLTKAIMQTEQWLKKAIAQTVADDIDASRGGEKRVNPNTDSYGGVELA
jgi:hypothetical protein